jgi:SanA protein
MLADRLETGVELYRLGKVEKLLLSGDHGTVPYDEVNAMRTYVIERGVPPEDIFMDHSGFSTFDSMYRARDVFLVTDALVVTQDFHLPRAVYTARALGLEATGVSADRRPYRDTGRLAVREWLARCKAFLQLQVLNSRPRFLGPTIPITGDGRATEG